MGRKFLVGGNWNSTQLVEAIATNTGLDTSKVEIVIAPATIHLVTVQQNSAMQQRKDIQVSAQNVYHQSGAFTGEISIDMVKDLGLQWVILGHSERRQIFGEADDFIGVKAKHCLEKGLKIIACIGETLEERKADKTMEVLERQMAAYAKNITKPEYWDQFVIAYEPVWAIGTGVVATTEQAQEVNGKLRQWLRQNVSSEVADKVRILYGGSVKPNNSDELAKQPDIDGFLVGGASLVASDFANIILSCQKMATEKSKL